MSNTSALARRLRTAIRQYKAKAKVKSTNTPVPILFYDPYGEREETWVNGPMPDDFQGTVFYMPYNDRDDDDGTRPLPGENVETYQ